jgi:cytoskeletal protein RodZ
MAEDNKDKLSIQSENNYGFPFVEVTPLEENSKKNTFSYEEPEREEKPVMSEEKPALIKEIKQSSVLVKKKRSQLPLQLSLVMIILIILSVMAYFLYFLPENNEGQFEQAFIPPKVELEEEPVKEIVPELPAESQKEESENDEKLEETVEEVAEVVKEASPPLSDSPLKTGNINKVTSKSGAPEYYIIVSSTVSEKVALDEAQKLIDKNNEVWLIYPYGETTNFRLAIGKYSAFAEATEALEKRKEDFDASIWILKY